MSDQKVKRYGPQSHPMELFYEDAQGAFVLASNYEVLEARVSALEADNASLRASLAEFKGDYGKLVDLEGQAVARVAALEAALRWVNEKYWPGHLRVGNDRRNPCHKGCEGCAWETNVRQALHPTSEAEL